MGWRRVAILVAGDDVVAEALQGRAQWLFRLPPLTYLTNAQRRPTRWSAIASTSAHSTIQLASTTCTSAAAAFFASSSCILTIIGRPCVITVAWTGTKRLAPPLAIHGNRRCRRSGSSLAVWTIRRSSTCWACTWQAREHRLPQAVLTHLT